MVYNHFVLENFQGPIDLLLLLVQKKELELFDIPLLKLLKQYITQHEKIPSLLEEDGDAIVWLSQLIYLKSMHLLPQDEEACLIASEELEQIELFSHLIEYAAFRKIAHTFSEKEKEAAKCFGRKVPDQQIEKKLGSIPLQALVDHFMQAFYREKKQTYSIQQEKWSIKDAIDTIKASVQNEQIAVHTLFSTYCEKEALIVTFLAILELIKGQEVLLMQQKDTLFLSKRGK